MVTETVTADTRHQQLLEQLYHQTQTLRTSEGWQRWIDFASRFTTYSLRNQLLILMQRPDATRVAGYRAWQALGRQVDKGERGIAIFAPRTRLVDDEDGERTRVVSGFQIVRVFDVRQTSGEPLPTLEMPAVSGGSEAGFGALVAAARSEELEVERVSKPGDWAGPRGWLSYDERKITLIDFGQGLGSMTRTLLHELGHWCDPAAGHTRAVDLTPVLEVVAESAAMIVGTSLLGLEVADVSALYVAFVEGRYGDTRWRLHGRTG